MKKYYLLVLSLFLFILVACDKEFTDPGKVARERAFNSDKALTSVAIGLQRTYVASRPGSIFTTATINGFVTNEVVLLNAGNIPELQLSTGGNSVDGTNTILLGLWTTSNKIIYDADLVIAGAEQLGDKGYASGLIAYATIFKALSIGNLAMFWEKIPTSIGENVSFADRAQGFASAITAIDKALATISTTPVSASFNTAIPPGIDLLNTLHALKARYSLYTGNYANALTSANLVNLSRTSVINFDATTLNPIFEVVTSTNNVYQPVDSTLGLPLSIRPDLADRRVQFYTTINTSIAPRFRTRGFGIATATPYPLYLPGEITLIKAECYARQAAPDLNLALTELNKVLTKTAATDILGVGAALPPITGPLTQAQLLEQIYKNRCIELFMSGLKLEDMRRFGRPNTERKRNFFPYPFKERDNNPNTPADPVF